jgi:protein tyrosine phosphatase (PTP) superfamily phosphohydrolase (DUF442 family)
MFRELFDTLRRAPLATLVSFLTLWLLLGFAFGTAVLLGPVRWTTNLTRARGWSDGAEKLIVVGFILLLVVVSASLAAKWAVWSMSGRWSSRIAAFTLSLMMAGGAYALWMRPQSVQAATGSSEDKGARFTFGPYPDVRKMRELKEEGYDAVITLLHPAVVPFEPQLLAREQEAARAAQMRLIHLPMLPWISQNADSIAKLRALATEKEGRYYIHCYLGRDRVMMAKRIVEQASGSKVKTEALGKARKITDVRKFERGDYYELEEGVWLTPMPTNEEYAAYILNGRFERVVSLLDPSSPGERKWLEEERAQVALYGMPFENVPLQSEPIDSAAVLGAVEKVKRGAKPVVVHTFLSPSTGKSTVGELFLVAYRSGRPPLAPGSFKEALRAGEGSVVAPHVAIGPTPRPSEIGSYLKARGVRSIVFVGDRPSDELRTGASEAKVELVELTPDAALQRLEKGGPFYLTGSGAAALRKEVEGRFGSAAKLLKK